MGGAQQNAKRERWPFPLAFRATITTTLVVFALLAFGLRLEQRAGVACVPDELLGG